MLHIDIETYSEADLTKTGVYRYAEDPSFEILLFGVAVDDNPVVVYDLKMGDNLPEEIISALQNNSITKWAFNAQFERVCLSRYLWDMGLLARGTYLDPHGWRCDMVWAGYMGFPMNLKGAGSALQLDEQKMEEGKSLITYFCKPYRQTSKNGYTNRNLPSHDPEKWELFKSYNKRDVEVEMAIAQKLSSHPVPEKVWEEYWEDQIINDRGILIDIPMVESAIELDTVSKSHLKEEMQSLSGLRNPQSVIQMQSWLKENGVELDSLGKKEIEAELEGIPEPMRSVLLLRQQLAMSAVKKYQAMDTAACSDGRCRGMFRFYGANRSGRFCLAEETPILVKTEEGSILEKPIEDVLLSDLVYDGNEWVHHDGVVYSGEKDVITWDGITATAEHKVFISEDEKIPLGEAREKGIRIWRGQSQEWTETVPPAAGYLKTYDILNAGPKNRFTANGRVVSNSGAIVQLQNLFRNSLPDLDSARALVKQGNYDALSILYHSIPEVLAQCVRTAFIPAPGYKFIVSDFSAIEARVLAWLAGEQWVLDVFASGGDIYCETASRMFGVPVVKHGINGDLRQKGKQATLSCIAEGQPVLTDRGLVPIEEVTPKDKLWDGEEWVNHDGVIYKGEREVITYEGLTATADHLVWVEGKKKPIQFGLAATSGAHLVQTGDGGRAIRLGENHKPGEEVEREMESLLCADAVSGVSVNPVADPRQPYKRQIKRVSELYTAEANTSLAGQETNGSKEKMRESKRSSISKLWSKRDKVRLSKCNRSRAVSNPEVRDSQQGDGTGQNRYEWKLCSRECTILFKDRKLQKQKGFNFDTLRAKVLALLRKCSGKETVVWDDERRDNRGCTEGCSRETEELASNRCTARLYDIRNAGRHHRFTVSGHLVHNCGYGGGVGALKAMGAIEAGMKEEELAPLVEAWRSSNPNIVKLWYAVDKAAKTAIKEKTTTRTHGLEFKYRGGMLYITLPSGRHLSYVRPRIGENRYGGESVTYMGTDFTKHWARIETFGGKLVENCLAEGTKVITNRGLVPIEKITPDLLIWDGEEFVKHDGLIYQGEKDVISVNGIQMTPDHKILTTEGWHRSGVSEGLTWAQANIKVSTSPCSEVKPVYDIRNCGPRHRFAVWNGEHALIVSNCVQAISRDILCSALDHLSSYRVVAHVHDECIVEVPPTTTVEEISSLMSIVPDWAPGLVLRADGYECPGYYLKD